MRRLEYFVVSESISMDSRKGSVSLFHVAHMATVSEIPTIIPIMYATAAWIDDDLSPDPSDNPEPPEEEHVLLKVISPGEDPENPGKPITNEFRRTICSNHRVEASVFGVGRIPIPSDGDLIFQLSHNGEEIAKHTVAVIHKG